MSPKIKWPNDIYVNHSKIAGILIENSIFGSNIKRSIVGIGININQTIFDTGNYNSFKLINKKENNIHRILEYLLYRFNTYYDQITDPDCKLQHEFDSYLYGKNDLRNFKTHDNVEIQARISGTTVEGKLKLTLENGDVRCYNHKEVIFN